MNAFAALVLALAAATVVPQKVPGAGIVPTTVHTVRPSRPARFAPHKVSAPVVRFVDSSGGCTTRTLAGDASGQTVTYGCAR